MRAFGALFQRFPRPIDVGIVAAGQAADGGAANGVGDLPHRFEIAGRGDRKAGFDDVDAQIDQRLGDFQLFSGMFMLHAGRLFAVAQRGVENANRPWRHRRRADGFGRLLAGCCRRSSG